jgi:hypothetical protein
MVSRVVSRSHPTLTQISQLAYGASVIVVDLAVDFNGIVLFEPSRLADFLGGVPADGVNLLQRFTTSEDGTEVVQRGIVVPILGINDGSYEVCVRMDTEPTTNTDQIVAVNERFPLVVHDRLVVADLAVFADWSVDLGWYDVDVAPGCYAVSVNGWRRVEHGRVTACGFEYVLCPTSDLIEASAQLDADMQVLTLDR